MATLYTFKGSRVNSPSKLEAKLANPTTTVGERHHEMTVVILQLVGKGVPDAEIFVQMARNYPHKTEKDIRNSIAGAHARNPGQTRARSGGVSPTGTKLETIVSKVDPAAVTQEALPTPLETGIAASMRFLQSVFKPEETVCITNASDEIDGKFIINNNGIFKPLEWWNAWFMDPDRHAGKGNALNGPAGAWVRINPCSDESGSDKGVSDFRHVLVECDGVSLEQQWSTFKASGLPIAAVIFSGGKSLHAWVKVDARNLDEYKQRRDAVYSHLANCGIDPANKNPSRWSRLPGAQRNGTEQALLSLGMGAASWGEWEREDAALATKSRDAELLARLDSVVFDILNPPPEEPVIFSLFAGDSEIEVCHPGNITTIEAHVKAGKSAYVAAGLASIFSDESADCLSWKSDKNPHEKAVLHFDTEQSRGDHFKLNKRTLDRANYTQGQPEWYKSYCVAGWDCAEMKAAITAAFARAHRDFNGVHSVWIDGGADLVLSPNDELDSNLCVKWLTALAIQYATVIIMVIHLNPSAPGQEVKSRGHLGSQLNRKSESVLRLTKDDEGITEVASPHMRRAPIPKGKNPRFQWKDEFGRQVTVMNLASVKLDKKTAEIIAIGTFLFQRNGGMAFRRCDAIKEIQRKLGQDPDDEKVSDSTATRKWKDLVDNGYVGKAIIGELYEFTPKGSAHFEPNQDGVITVNIG